MPLQLNCRMAHVEGEGKVGGSGEGGGSGDDGGV